jgi:hypothetical protein
MNINRHNYETFFLLYVDNELSATERKVVEQFVQENADLGTELQLLLGTTLSNESIKFNAKDLLFKTTVDQNDFQENMLLHLDNELNAERAAELEKAIADKTSLLAEWNLLKQTRLDANEKIIFEKKQSLYRHEKGRVIGIRFWRIAAAAAILIACLFAGISLLKKQRVVEDSGIAKQEGQKPGEKKIGSNDTASIINSTKARADENVALASERKQKNASVEPDASVDPVVKVNVVPVKKETDKGQIAKAAEKNIPSNRSLENINNPESNKSNTPAVLNRNNETIIKNTIPDQIASVPKNKISVPSAPLIDYNSIPPMQDSYAKTAVLNEGSSGNDNKILYMSEETITRSKIGGIFRKVKRIIERNTNINTGKGVNIAGFEIAVK